MKKITISESISKDRNLGICFSLGGCLIYLDLILNKNTVADFMKLLFTVFTCFGVIFTSDKPLSELHLSFAGLAFMNGIIDVLNYSSSIVINSICMMSIVGMPFFIQNKDVFGKLEILFLFTFTIGMLDSKLLP